MLREFERKLFPLVTELQQAEIMEQAHNFLYNRISIHTVEAVCEFIGVNAIITQWIREELLSAKASRNSPAPARGVGEFTGIF